jgi:20S proteasome alpha/beta subunit
MPIRHRLDRVAISPRPIRRIGIPNPRPYSRPAARARGPMTVCVAALSRWKYPDGLDGSAVVLASDRMMTSADTEYEPPKRKVGNLTDRSLIMVAGDFTAHSQLVLMASEKIKSRGLTRISELAEAYAEAFREYRARQASAVYLEPIGLNLDTFISRQSDMNSDLVFRLYDTISNYRVDAEAIIAGYDTAAHIYMVDQTGLVTCHDEIGFAAIGTGYSHAKFQFMSGQYASWWPFFTHW